LSIPPKNKIVAIQKCSIIETAHSAIFGDKAHHRAAVNLKLPIRLRFSVYGQHSDVVKLISSGHVSVQFSFDLMQQVGG
jgi:hypothetical protein